MRRISLFSLISLLFLAVFYGYHSVRLTDKNFHLIFCDVGQGDGIFIRTPKGVDIVVDGGPDENGMADCLSRHLPIWDRNIDVVYMTHPDADHLTGLIGIFRTYNIKYFGTPKVEKDTAVYDELMAVLQSKNIQVDWLSKGDMVRDKNGFSLETMWPTKEFLASVKDEANDYSLVQKVVYKKFTALLTGDVPSAYLNSVMPLVGAIDVFKLPHHGSKTGVDEFTFQHTIPKLAVISVGKDNRYNHPSPEVLKLLKDTNIPYKDTLSGDIEIISDGERWWLK